MGKLSKEGRRGAARRTRINISFIMGLLETTPGLLRSGRPTLQSCRQGWDLHELADRTALDASKVVRAEQLVCAKTHSDTPRAVQGNSRERPTSPPVPAAAGNGW